MKEGRIPLDRVVQIPTKETAQNGAWRETENGHNTVNTSPKAERGAGKYLETRTLIAWIPLPNYSRMGSPTPSCRDFSLLIRVVSSPWLPRGLRMVVIHLGFQHMVLNRIWMRPSFLEKHLENREGNINWTDGRNGHQKETQDYSE